LTAGPASAASTSRGRRRRQAVVDAAATLFLERGFHGTSIDDIGERAGISGPGVYRHFPSKDAVLSAVTDRLWERLKPALSAAAETAGPQEALEVLLEAHVAMAIEEPTALVLLVRELRHLPGGSRSSALRKHARYVAAWSGVFQRLAPGLGDAEARSATLAVHGLLESASRHPQVLDRERRRSQLTRMARAAIDEVLAPNVVRG
jgi:AcrR family transcriptional regulator